jgi:hypothetical protein
MFRSRDSQVLPPFDVSYTSSPESTPNCTIGRKNQLHTVDWDEFKYGQLHWAPIVEVYMIAVPLNVPYHIVYNGDYSLKNDISKHDYCKNGYRSFHHSIEHPDGSGEEFRDQLSHETRHRQWRQLSQLHSIRPMRDTEYNRDIESNTIPTSQLSAIISQRSHNGRDALP